MEQYSYLINSSVELQTAARKVQKKLDNLPQSTELLISVYTPRNKEELSTEILNGLRNIFPDKEIVGAISTKEIIDGQLTDNGVVVSFTFFETSRAKVYSFDGSELSPEAMGEKLLKIIKETDKPRAVQLLLSDSSLDITSFLEIISEAPGDIKFFGGLADDGSLGEFGSIYANGKLLTSGIVATIFSGDNLKVKVESCFGWRPLGSEMTITGLDGSYVVKEINGVAAADIYAKYLDIHRGKKFLRQALTFPLYFYRNGKVLARHPNGCREDGALTFGADFRLGEKIRLAYGDPDSIIKNADEIRDRMATFSPQVIFTTSCVARWLLLQDDISYELRTSRELAPSSGFYAYGEFMRVGRELTVSNMTLVVVGMREGEQNKKIPKSTAPEFNCSGQTDIMRHMVHFITVTSKELQQANEKLAKLANTDRLTRLLNRGELENIIESELSDGKSNKRPVALMMMDIDDFKSINDTYGHMTGDVALKSLAEILKENTRRHDHAARFGGDEFVVVFRNMNAEEAFLIAERIRQSVKDLRFLPDDKFVTASIGITESNGQDTLKSLIERADTALYRAKRSKGKDSVYICR